jgi:hypothetical protein
MSVAQPPERGTAEFWFRRPAIADCDIHIGVVALSKEHLITAGTSEAIPNMVGRLTAQPDRSAAADCV